MTGETVVEVRMLGTATRVVVEPDVAATVGPLLSLASTSAGQPPGHPEWRELRAVLADRGGRAAGDLPRFSLLDVSHEDGRTSEVVGGDPVSLLVGLLLDTEERAARRAGGLAVLSAGCAWVGGRRLLFCGSGSPGITTLLLALGSRGHRLECDQRVVLADGAVGALARPFAVPTLATAHLPWLTPSLTAPALRRNGWGEPVHLIDPRRSGCDWRAGVGPVDGVVVAEGNHGGRTSARGMPTWQALQAVADGARPCGGPDGRRWIAGLCATLGSVACVHLRIGDPERAADALELEPLA